MRVLRYGLLIPILVIVSAGLYLVVRFSDTPPIDTDILSLLPTDVQDSAVAAAMTRANEVAARHMALRIEGGDPAARHQAAAELEKALADTGVFRSAVSDGQTLWHWLFNNRASLLCPADRARLLSGAGTDIKQAAARQWYSPFSSANARLMQTDPFLLTSRLLACPSRSSFAAIPAPPAAMITGFLTASAFRLDVQDRIATVLSDWQRKWAPEGVSVSRAGAVFHATAGAQTARAEISLIGGVTTLAILLLFWLVFASLRAPALALFVVLAGLITGFAITLILFDTVHIMAVVFGAALIGITVDYAIHYLVTGLDTPVASTAARRMHVMRGLSVSMATSVGAFACLLLFPVPAFRQIAVFGSAGLIAAWMTTLVLLPPLARVEPRLGLAALWLDRLASRLLVHDARPPVLVGLIGFAAVILAGSFVYGPVLDNVRQFQKPSAALLAEEVRVRQDVGGTAPSGVFFLVTGDSREAATAHEEALLDFLHSTPDQSAAFGASELDPSPARRRENQALLKAVLTGPQSETFPNLAEVDVVQAYEGTGSQKEAVLPEWIASLRGQTGPVFWSIVPLSGPAGDIDRRIRFHDLWVLVDPAERYSGLLAHYRVLATYGLAVAVLPTALILLMSYRRIAALRILLPPLAALAATPAIMALVGLPYSFFSAIGLFLVFGAGIDFSIFQWEHPGVSGRWTRVGILLAALTSGLALGLLGASSVFPVQAFGMTVAIGMLICLILSPLARSAEAASLRFPRGPNGF